VRKKIIQCTRRHCNGPLYLGGLCRFHHDESAEKERLRDAALTLLHLGVIDDKLPEDEGLKSESEMLRKWWNKVCRAQNMQIVDPILQDESPYAGEWCISLAQEMVLATRATRRGETVSPSLEFCREWVWERFNNLESGLNSNGTSRKNVS